MAIKWFVPGIWPRHYVNHVIGVSGAGKSRWMLPQLYALQQGQPVLGRPTQPTKIAYVLCDRPKQDAMNTIESLGLDPERIPIFSFMDVELQWTLDNVMKNIPPETELVFIEAIACITQANDMSSYHAALSLIRKCHIQTKRIGISFWGSTHPPKLKKGEAFISDRNAGIGSVGIPGSSGTIAVFYELENNEREIHILPHDGPPLVLNYVFNEKGQLVETSTDISKALLDHWLRSIPPEVEISSKQIQEHAERAGVYRTLAFQWIEDVIREGWLERIQKGWYRKRGTQ